ncbi:unnamed protein product [Strongylus vulgaris]|uniref:Uncharacterized protein n=1 Tax=Strongylus vulgaris TaxID=40348 RepID=A0A3P7J4S7_STRVU|nr:unnamed protein product [Strongylus vulgaris]
MSLEAGKNHWQLYTKRNFIKVGDGDRIVCLKRRIEHPSNKKQQRIIRLVPVPAESALRRGDILTDLQSPSASDVTREYNSVIGKLLREKSILEQELKSTHKEKTNVNIIPVRLINGLVTFEN